MKSKWVFRFECKRFRFDGIQKFGGYLDREAIVSSDLSPENPDFLLSIEPDTETKLPWAEQTGKLNIVLSGDMEQTKEMVYWLADHASEYISFFNGELKVSYGYVAGEYLPETLEEEEQLGERRHFRIVHLAQYPPPHTFDGSSFQRMTIDSAVNPKLQQFNAALNANNPIDQFLGLFRIIEDFYDASSTDKKLANRLKASSELIGIACKYLKVTENDVSRPLTKDDSFRLIDELVSIRHQCAHLRTSVGFGIPHGDPKVGEKVLPLIMPLRRLAFEAIRIRLKEDE
jgi:hypothetical protein